MFMRFIPKFIKKIVYSLQEKKKTEFFPVISKAEEELVRLGTAYGGWSFLDRHDLRNSTILSLGAGEDISFDVEFATRYDAKIVIVDPTPRAIEHIRKVRARIGLPASREHTKDGDQPPESYDLSDITDEQILFIEKAVWKKSGSVKFFKPNNEKSVSHSIVNFKNDYNTSSQFPHILVPAMTIEEILSVTNMPTPPLLKMDIEGAELDVLPHMFKRKIFPGQLLVEFDGLANRDKKNHRLYSKLDALVRDNGYVCFKFDPPSNLLYARPELSYTQTK